MADFAAEGGPRHFADNQYISVAGVVASSKTRTTKNNTLMSYIQLEDDTGTMELMAFQKALDKGGMYIKDNAPIFVRGRISARDEKEPQLMVDSIRPIADVLHSGGQAVSEASAPQPTAPSQPEKKLWVKLPSADDPRLKRIQPHPHHVPRQAADDTLLRREKSAWGCGCLIHEGLVEELKELLGSENVVVK